MFQGFPSLRPGLLALAIAAAAGSPTLTYAQEEEEVASVLDFSAGVDITTHYFFRGILQENQGLIIQPYGSVSTSLYESEGTINNVTATFGTWNSLHGGPSGGEGHGLEDPRWWYEADLFAGLSVGFLESWSAAVTYTYYCSPNDAFDAVQDITLGLSYDDSSWWGDSGFTIAPAVAVVYETKNEADGGNTALGLSGSGQGWYFQGSLKPSFTLIESESYPVTLSFPLIVGLGHDYYEIDRDDDGEIDDDSCFGYASGGIFLSTPLAFLPGGDWTASVGITFLVLGDTTRFINNGEKFEHIMTFSLGVNF
jgi:hypothetical protein